MEPFTPFTLGASAVGTSATLWQQAKSIKKRVRAYRTNETRFNTILCSIMKQDEQHLDLLDRLDTILTNDSSSDVMPLITEYKRDHDNYKKAISDLIDKWSEYSRRSKLQRLLSAISVDKEMDKKENMVSRCPSIGMQRLNIGTFSTVTDIYRKMDQFETKFESQIQKIRFEIQSMKNEMQLLVPCRVDRGLSRRTPRFLRTIPGHFFNFCIPGQPCPLSQLNLSWLQIEARSSDFVIGKIKINTEARDRQILSEPSEISKSEADEWIPYYNIGDLRDHCIHCYLAQSAWEFITLEKLSSGESIRGLHEINLSNGCQDVSAQLGRIMRHVCNPLAEIEMRKQKSLDDCLRMAAPALQGSTIWVSGLCEKDGDYATKLAFYEKLCSLSLCCDAVVDRKEYSIEEYWVMWCLLTSAQGKLAPSESLLHGFQTRNFSRAQLSQAIRNNESGMPFDEILKLVLSLARDHTLLNNELKNIFN